MKHSKQPGILKTYRMVMYLCIIYNQNTQKTWIWCCVWYYLFFDGIDEHVWIVWPSNDLPINKAITSVCRKNRPLFWSLYRWYKTYWLTFWRSTILKLKRTFIHGWHRTVLSIIQGLRMDGTRFYRVKSSSKYNLSSGRWDQDKSRRPFRLFGQYEMIWYRNKNDWGRHPMRDRRN